MNNLEELIKESVASAMIETTTPFREIKHLAYWSFFRIKSFKVPIIAYICGIYKFMYAKNAFSAALKRSSVMEK